MLARAGADTTAKANDGRTALIAAACSGSAAAVQLVLSVGGSEREARDRNGWTALLLACAKGHADCITVLAAAGCDTKAKTNDGLTALTAAAGSGNAAALQAVLDSGGAAEGHGAKGGKESVALLLACVKGHADSIAVLARAGCDTTAKTKDGWTALMAAVRSRNAAAVETVCALLLHLLLHFRAALLLHLLLHFRAALLLHLLLHFRASFVAARTRDPHALAIAVAPLPPPSKSQPRLIILSILSFPPPSLAPLLRYCGSASRSWRRATGRDRLRSFGRA